MKLEIMELTFEQESFDDIIVKYKHDDGARAVNSDLFYIKQASDIIVLGFDAIPKLIKALCELGERVEMEELELELQQQHMAEQAISIETEEGTEGFVERGGN